MVDPDVLARAMAAAVNDVVTVAELTKAEVSPRFAQRMVARGRWQRVARGTYVTHTRPLTNLELARAAAAYVDGRCIVTGLLVLDLHNARWLPTWRNVHVLVPEDVRRPSSLRVRVSRSKAFDAIDTWTMGELRFASTPQAVIDAARCTRTLRDVRGIVLAAVADKLATAAELSTILDAGQRNGSALTRRAIGDATRGCASPPEAELVDAMIGRGMPFLVNPEIWLDGVRLGFADVWLVGTAVGGEVESDERHGDEEGRTATYDRHERFADGGLELVHLSVARIRRNVVAAAVHLLGRAASSVAPVPAGLVVVPHGPVLR